MASNIVFTFFGAVGASSTRLSEIPELPLEEEEDISDPAASGMLAPRDMLLQDGEESWSVVSVVMPVPAAGLEFVDRFGHAEGDLIISSIAPEPAPWTFHILDSGPLLESNLVFDPLRAPVPLNSTHILPQPVAHLPGHPYELASGGGGHLHQTTGSAHFGQPTSNDTTFQMPEISAMIGRGELVAVPSCGCEVM